MHQEAILSRKKWFTLYHIFCCQKLKINERYLSRILDSSLVGKELELSAFEGMVRQRFHYVCQAANPHHILAISTYTFRFLPKENSLFHNLRSPEHWYNLPADRPLVLCPFLAQIPTFRCQDVHILLPLHSTIL
jgi:hypothetical protein